MRLKVPFLGVSTQSNYEEGECIAMLNARPSKGAYKPVSPRKVMQTLSEKYDIVFVHKGSGYENWIGIKNKKIYTNIKQEPLLLSDLSESVSSVEQIGNTLSFITDSTIYYALYKNNSYLMLGKIPELPAMTFKTSENLFAIKSYDATGLHSMNNEDWFKNVKATVYIARNLLINGGTDAINNSYTAQGQHLFDAHILRYAYRLYDDTLIHYSPPILIMPSIPILELNRTVKHNDSKWYVHVTGYRALISMSKELSTDWNNIIKSIDFFISPPIGISNIENMIKKIPKDEEGFNIDSNLISEITKESIENLHSFSNLYFIHSMELDYNGQYALLSGEKDGSAFKDLIYQEEMPVETLSFHGFGANVSYIHNSRLHLADLKMILFKGFSPQYFAFTNSYNGSKSLSNPVGGGISLAVNIIKMISEVTINVNGQTQKVYSEITGPNLSDYNISAIISYPDPRAKKISIYAIDENNDWKELITTKLFPHKGFNIAYYISDDLLPIGFKYIPHVNPINTNLPSVPIYEQNKLKVSELNNPFYFPNANNYTVGNGTILAIGTVMARISEGSFGQYPLYVFGLSGIYSLSIGSGDVLYAHQSAPTSAEVPISNVFCHTPYGIVFISNRGLCMIWGQEIILLSSQLREDGEKLELQDIGVNSPFIHYPQKYFTKYLRDVDLIFYNPYEDEIIICDRESPYSYVYHFPSKSFYLLTEKINQIVRNIFPEVLVIGGNEIKDFKYSEEKTVDIAVVTRPLRFGTDDIKKMERVLLRSVMYNVNNNSAAGGEKMALILLHSQDGVNFTPTRGIKLSKNGNYKDFDMGLFARTKYRYYIFMLVGKMDEDSEIKGIEFEVDKEYLNEKMR